MKYAKTTAVVLSFVAVATLYRVATSSVTPVEVTEPSDE